MATVRKRGTTRPFRWEAQVRMRGSPTRTKTFPTKADAEQWASELEAEMRRGTFVDTSSLRATTMQDLLARYLRDVTPTKKGREPETYRLKAMMRSPMPSVVASSCTACSANGKVWIVQTMIFLPSLSAWLS